MNKTMTAREDGLLALANELEMAWNTAEEFDMDEFADKIRALAEQPAGAVEMSPEFTDSARAALAWVLYHHQGGSSPVGQPIRFALGMGKHERMPSRLVDDAEKWAEQAGASTEYFHTPPAASVDVEGLHPRTADLVQRFATALAEKLAAAERKYGYSDGWADPEWMEECRAKLVEHVAKGDPRDVAAYCAFLWHHGERTALIDSAGGAKGSAEVCDDCGEPLDENEQCAFVRSESRSGHASQPDSGDIYEAYKTWPADIRKKLSLHDLRRICGWAPRTGVGDWRIDTSAGRPILVHKDCSVIEGEDARYVLGLIEKAATPQPDSVDGEQPASLRHLGVGRDKRGAMGHLYGTTWDGQAYADASASAVEWQRRALEAEENLRRYIENDNPTFMGEPVLPRPSAAAVVAKRFPDDGNGDDDSYNAGWNARVDALAQPRAE